MTSSPDARQDWQASVLRDLTPPKEDEKGHEVDDSADVEQSAVTRVVSPESLGITLPKQQAQSGAAPGGAQPPGAAEQPAYPQPPVSDERAPFPGFPRQAGPPEQPAFPPPPAGGEQPAFPQPPGRSGFPQPPGAPGQPAFPPPPGAAGQPPFPPYAPSGEQPAFPPQPGYPGFCQPAGGEQAGYPEGGGSAFNPAAPSSAVPAPTSGVPETLGAPQPGQYGHYPTPQSAPPQQPYHPQQPYQPPPGQYGPPPQQLPVPAYPHQAPGQSPSRVFGPDATPIPEQWTPEGLLQLPAHADNWHQRLRTSVRGIGGSAAKASREAAEVAEVLSRPVTTGRRIAVLGIRGGSGKSTVASLLASAYATHRGDRVLAVDADPDLGSLGLRLGASSPTSLVALGRVPRVWQTLDEAERCLGRAPSGAWILSGERGSAQPETVPPNAYLGVLHGISRYFAVTVVDAGAGMVTQLNQSVLADAHAIVLATPASIDGVVSARRALEWIRDWNQQRLPQTVVALTAMSPQAGDIDMGRTVEALAPYGVPPALLPYDRHLATGSTIEPWRLGERTRNSAVQLAAAALSRARMV